MFHVKPLCHWKSFKSSVGPALMAGCLTSRMTTRQVIPPENLCNPATGSNSPLSLSGLTVASGRTTSSQPFATASPSADRLQAGSARLQGSVQLSSDWKDSAFPSRLHGCTVSEGVEPGAGSASRFRTASVVGRRMRSTIFSDVARYFPGMPLRGSRFAIYPSCRAAVSRRHAADLSSLSAKATSWALAPSVSVIPPVAVRTAAMVSAIDLDMATP